MSRRVWTGLLAGVLGAMLLLGVAAGAYRIGRDDTVVRSVGDGEVVRVVGHGWGYGPGPGFFLFPLLVFGIVALLVWGRRGWGWGGGRGYGGPGSWSRCGPEGGFAEWHDRAHADQAAAGSATQTGQPGDTGPPTATV